MVDVRLLPNGRRIFFFFTKQSKSRKEKLNKLIKLRFSLLFNTTIPFSKSIKIYFPTHKYNERFTPLKTGIYRLFSKRNYYAAVNVEQSRANVCD